VTAEPNNVVAVAAPLEIEIGIAGETGCAGTHCV